MHSLLRHIPLLFPPHPRHPLRLPTPGFAVPNALQLLGSALTTNT